MAESNLKEMMIDEMVTKAYLEGVANGIEEQKETEEGAAADAVVKQRQRRKKTKAD